MIEAKPIYTKGEAAYYQMGKREGKREGEREGAELDWRIIANTPLAIREYWREQERNRNIGIARELKSRIDDSREGKEQKKIIDILIAKMEINKI